jgi:hypothetical protein
MAKAWIRARAEESNAKSTKTPKPFIEEQLRHGI